MLADVQRTAQLFDRTHVPNESQDLRQNVRAYLEDASIFCLNTAIHLLEWPDYDFETCYVLLTFFNHTKAV